MPSRALGVAFVVAALLALPAYGARAEVTASRPAIRLPAT
jgi:hypothetical protein